LVSLAAAARRDRTPGLLWSHTQQLSDGSPVVVAPTGADYTRAALHTLLDSRRDSVSLLRSAVEVHDTVVIADCGRLDGSSPAMAIARDADRVLLVVRPVADELTHLAAALSMVDLWSMRPSLLLVGPGYPADEITRELGVPVAARIPLDVKGARALSSHAGSLPGLARSRLGRAAHQFASSLASAAPPPPAREIPLERHATAHSARWHTPRTPFPASRNGLRLENPS
jgi:hypothetical protein